MGRTCLLLCVMLTMISSASAQPNRRAWLPYFDVRLGLNGYGGERRGTYDSWFDEWYDTGGAGFGLEGGLILSPRWSAGIFTFSNRYPGLIYINTGRPREAINTAQSSDWIHTLGAVGRMRLPSLGQVNPYLQVGGGLSFSLLNNHVYIAAGPRLGLGADMTLSESLTLFAELDGLFVVPGNAMDLAGPGSDYDPFTFFGVGARYRLRSLVPEQQRPVYLLNLFGAGELEAGEEGLYAADVRLDSWAPYLRATWDFGDGKTSTRLVTSHSYLQPGSYTVTFVLTNGVWTERRTLTTVVEDPVRPVEILSMRVLPLVPRVGDAVTFDPVLTGSEPVSCRWDFGDGASDEVCDASHRFMRAGTYAVQLEARNARGTTQLTREVTVRENPCADLARLHPVYFGRNEATLDVDARGFLRENIARLVECPSIRLQLAGSAEPGERNGTRLAVERAKAVAQYYINLGIPASRIEVVEEGQVAAVPSGEAVWQYRSVESIPKQR